MSLRMKGGVSYCMNELSMFERFLFEAPGDDPPPDVAPPDQPEETSDPPDMPADISDDPPDMGGDPGEMPDDGPPDMPGDDFGGDSDPDGMDMDGSDPSEQNAADLGLDEKISSIMNMNLYQRFLSLLNTISSQLTMLKNNGDVLYTLSENSLGTIKSLEKLEENIRLYLKNYFLNENYSKNLLFFNKCLNLLKLLTDVFDENIKKGIKAMK